MPTELAFPFSIAPGGTIAATTDPDVQIGQHVETIVATEPGERVILTDYGVSGMSQLFASDSGAVAARLAQQVETALEKYEPGVYVNNVQRIATDERQGISRIEVDYTRREAANSASSLSRNVNTAVVHVGGRVSEAVAG